MSEQDLAEALIAKCDPGLRLTHIQWDLVRDHLLIPLLSEREKLREALQQLSDVAEAFLRGRPGDTTFIDLRSSVTKARALVQQQDGQ